MNRPKDITLTIPPGAPRKATLSICRHNATLTLERLHGRALSVSIVDDDSHAQIGVGSLPYHPGGFEDPSMFWGDIHACGWTWFVKITEPKVNEDWTMQLMKASVPYGFEPGEDGE